MKKKMMLEQIEACRGGVGSGWFDYSVTHNGRGGTQVDTNAIDGGIIRYEYNPPEKKVSTTEFKVEWNLNERKAKIPGVTEGSFDTGVTRTYYPPTPDGAYQAYREGERWL